MTVHASIFMALKVLPGAELWWSVADGEWVLAYGDGGIHTFTGLTLSNLSETIDKLMDVGEWL